MNGNLRPRHNQMRVIFHGDDFGLTSGVNRGILCGFREGLLTSASIIAGGEAGQEALSLAREAPGLDTGIHLTLCDERPVLPPSDLRSIIPWGDRFPSRDHLVKRIVSGRIDYREAAAEWEAQVETVLKAGVSLSHADSHQFVHLFPGLLRICLKVVRKHDIPFVRAGIVDPPSLAAGPMRLMQWVGLATWSRAYASRFISTQVRAVPSVGFILAGGRMTRKRLIRTLSRLQSQGSCRTVEVILHPGTGDGHTLYKYRHWDYRWKKDLDLLLDPLVKNDLDLLGIARTSFREEP